MTKPFTEEQYQEIIQNFIFASGNLPKRFNTVLEKFYEEFPMRIRDGIDDLIIMAFINPISRNDTHDQFVEKEKKYVWRLKTDKNLVISTLFDGWFLDTAPNANNIFSEKEIENSPFNPEWFDKEKV